MVVRVTSSQSGFWPLLTRRIGVDPSFQILHALDSVECLLEKFQRRSAVFEIVFWLGDFQSLRSILLGDY